MKSAKYYLITPFLFLLILLMAVPAYSQNEVQFEQAALQGINSFYVSLNVEGNKKIMRYDTLEVDQLQQEIKQKIRETGLPLKQKRSTERGRNTPMLHIHVNVMDAGQGLIPFSVEINFYQPVKLVLNRDIQTSASTWNSGYLGIVSYDRMDLIRRSMLSELENFIREFKRANS